MAISRVQALLVVAGLLPGFAQGGEVSTSQIDFNRDIRPILSDNCFACHGPDEGARKAKLRLDRPEEAIKPARSGETPIVPGEPSKSEIIIRVTAEDEDDRMPPASSGKTLSATQIDLLRRWIEQGAKWQTHWAFAAPERPEVPAVSDASWPRNEIDHFVLSKLAREGLKPSPEAEKPVLIRRASLDLTGLPPTVEEVDAFLADGSPDAYEKVVDRLMNWQRFGEHQARYWMDAVRYADTHGYHIDSHRDMWKYRDWVINAFNDNLPFDKFTTDQLAGDLQPNPSLEQKIATGFVRANMTTGEGGAIDDEYRAKYTFDRVETTGTIFMGMTLTCARCHTHKYDPIQHHEYYGLYAFFNQVDDKVMDENKPNPEPFLKVPSKEQAERMDWLKEHIAQRQGELEAPMVDLDTGQKYWQRDWAARLAEGWAPLDAARARSVLTNGAELRLMADLSIQAEGANPDKDVHEVMFAPAPGEISALRLEVLPSELDGKSTTGRSAEGTFAISELEVDLVRPTTEGHERSVRRLKFSHSAADSEAKEGGIGRALDGNADTGWQVPTNSVAQPHVAVFVPAEPLRIQIGDELNVRLRSETAKPRAALARYRISVARGESSVDWWHPPSFGPWHVLGPLKPKDGTPTLESVYEPETKVDLKKKFPGVREEVGWSERRDYEDGRASLLVQDLHGVHGIRYLYRTLTLPRSRTLELHLRADGPFRLWVNGEQVAERHRGPSPSEPSTKVTVQLKEGENRFLWKVVTVQGAAYFTFSPDMGSADALTPEIAAVLAVSPSTAENESKLRTYYRRQHSPAFRERHDELVNWKQELEVTDRAVPTTMVAKEAGMSKETFMLLRGEYDKKGDKVEPHVPAIFPPLPDGAPTNRLGLAQWLLDPAHPLTARVTVNRIWQQHFGVGLVKTTEDFGMQGEHPSHPELLDWLATEFIRSGWDVKHMHRLIVTSATYRQSSRATPELLERDPENRLLARGPRFRLDAEAIRDTALFVSGLLVEKVGGRSVRPYEPPGLWEAVSFNNSQKYVEDAGDAQYRRSLYTYWKRQSPPPNMMLFDAPTRESCTVRRSRSNTPLQALALLNDPQFVEAARAFAQRIILEGGDGVRDRARFAFRLATSRDPSNDELAVLCGFFEEQCDTFRHDPSAAEKFLTVGPFTPKADLDPAELAAWAALGSLILNLDEAITKG
jgi:hypothetical protein